MDDDVGVVVVVLALVVRGLALGVDASVDITANPGAVVVMRSSSMVVLCVVASVVQVMASSFKYLERMQLAAFSN